MTRNELTLSAKLAYGLVLIGAEGVGVWIERFRTRRQLDRVMRRAACIRVAVMLVLI